MDHPHQKLQKKIKKKKTKSPKKKNTKKNGSKPSSPKKAKSDQDKDTKDTKSKDTKDKSTKKGKTKAKDSKDTKATTKTDTDNNNKETAPKESNGAKSDDKETNDKSSAKADTDKSAEAEPEPEKKETETEPKKDEDWDQYDNLRISDNEEEPAENGGSYTIPTLGKQESVVDALMSGPYGPGDKTEETKDTEKSKDEDKDIEPEEEAIDFTSTDLEKEKSDAVISVSQGTMSHSVSTAAVMGDDEEWDRYDDLRISDEDNDGDEVKEPEKTNTPGLYVPLVPLKTQGSVVDMLMDGPESKPAPKSAFIVTPPAPEDDDIPSPPDDIVKDYSITVSHGSKTEVKVDGKLGKDVKDQQEKNLDDLDAMNAKADQVEAKLNKILDKDDKESNGYVKTKEATRISKDEDDTITVTYFKADDNDTTTENKEDDSNEDDNAERKTISLSADAFVYNENTNSYTISLSSARLMRSDFIKGMITFEISGKRVDKDKSDKAEKQMDDKYIDSVLDEIERDNPDSDQD